MLYCIGTKNQRGYPRSVSWGLQDVYIAERCTVCGGMSSYPGNVSDVHVLNGNKWPDVIEGMPLIISGRLHTAWEDAGLNGCISRRMLAIPIPYGQEFIMKSYHGKIASVPSECRIKSGNLTCFSISVPTIATVNPKKTMVKVIHRKKGEYISESAPTPLCDVPGACHRCGGIKNSDDSIFPESIALIDGPHHENQDFYYWGSSVFISVRAVEVCLAVKATNLKLVKSEDALNVDAPCLKW